MKRPLILLLAVALILSMAAGCSSQVRSDSMKTPKYVFLFIGDGMGNSHRQLAEYGNQLIENDPSAMLNMDSLPYSGIMMTTPADRNMITDSAAAGSAMATGYKYQNGALAIDENDNPHKTIAEAAKDAGKSIGIVSNGKVAGATPASFTAHISDRDLQNDIADQQFLLDIDFYGCSGYRNLIPMSDPSGDSRREDERNLVEEYKSKGYDTFIGEDGVAAFRSYAPKAGSKVLAAFTSGSYPYEIDIINQGIDLPSLAEVTQKGIDTLKTNKDGFFFLIEDDVLDDCGHYCDGAGVIRNVIALDDAVKTALAFYDEHKEDTLIIVAADHDTGGLSIGTDNSYDMNTEYLVSITGSFEDNIEYEPGESDAFYAMLKDVFKFEPTREQKAQLDAEMKKLDDLDEMPDLEENPLGILAVNMINEKAHLGWSTWEHAANPVPITAIGADAEKLSGYMENTAFAKRLAQIMDLQLD